ncbi:hypothetical protein HANVADRAFT_50968 [Hanseniaspora valbyensis NRRL Y-1626]|uniref:C2H2-type domain-containing protein n=1 Tax=Hanseniaspora valbyensis NRRL Y-1626 TaxID=766949 RepID=A0A1B7TJU8_9ASCO|nr:hypothetical protein HANVADRAFT_50968 [Hanseniaspora valbyensis NRRL Y-1626]
MDLSKINNPNYSDTGNKTQPQNNNNNANSIREIDRKACDEKKENHNTLNSNFTLPSIQSLINKTSNPYVNNRNNFVLQKSLSNSTSFITRSNSIDSQQQQEGSRYNNQPFNQYNVSSFQNPQQSNFLLQQQLYNPFQHYDITNRTNNIQDFIKRNDRLSTCSSPSYIATPSMCNSGVGGGNNNKNLQTQFQYLFRSKNSSVDIDRHILNENDSQKDKKQRNVFVPILANELEDPTHYIFPTSIQEPNIVREYKCKVCDKKVKGLTAFQNHLKIHSGISSSFICDYCGQIFNAKQNLVRHKKRHDEITLQAQQNVLKSQIQEQQKFKQELQQKKRKKRNSSISQTRKDKKESKKSI